MTENSTCLACGSDNLRKSLDLGIQPLANSYLQTKDDEEDLYPLGLKLCLDCHHLQLTHTVNPEIIYKNYLYVSGTSSTLKTYSKWFANFVKEYVGDFNDNNVLDIGCNDGTQLDYFKSIGFVTYGIDPAENIHENRNNNHNVICDFFNPKITEKLNRTFDVIIAQNVFAHNPNPLSFLVTCNKLMHKDSTLFIQTSQADMVLNNEFDTIYHEHVNFFNSLSMLKLCERSGLNLIDVIKSPIHGNSYIFIISKTKKQPNRINNIIEMEDKMGLFSTSTYENWEKTVSKNMFNLKNTIHNLKIDGYKVIGYGAAAKGNTLLNYTNISLDFIVDDNPLKWGLYCPGSKVLIKSPEDLSTIKGKVAFIPLAWNFFNEISIKIKTYRNENEDLFVKYFPSVSVTKNIK
jgi:2-polyprenyl-3-methyl-5-hydroxy-6-metoxy-1,4-benzoquinol methylase